MEIIETIWLVLDTANWKINLKYQQRYFHQDIKIRKNGTNKSTESLEANFRWTDILDDLNEKLISKIK